MRALLHSVGETCTQYVENVKYLAQAFGEDELIPTATKP